MNKRISKGKFIKPTFFVFCEGKTEEIYIKYLRSTYRLPIDIDPKIAGNRITERYIKDHKKHKIIHEKDKTFLIYDCDVEAVLQKLLKIKNVSLLCSNPCIEFWYLLHCQNHKSILNSEDCVAKLKVYIKNYKKGIFDEKLQNKMIENKIKAINRAKATTKFSNPSTNVYKLIEELDLIKRRP
jgi:hypothetical protein